MSVKERKRELDEDIAVAERWVESGKHIWLSAFHDRRRGDISREDYDEAWRFYLWCVDTILVPALREREAWKARRRAERRAKREAKNV